MRQKLNKKFFNKSFLFFTFRLVLKKISIYITITTYLFLILSYTFIVPFLSHNSAIKLFIYPIAPSFLFLSMVVVSCFIAIEIFRTPIEDGTELLVLSKPIDRREICIAKFLVFIFYILIISFLSFIVASTSHLYPNSYYEDNMNIMIGIFIASLTTGIVFGSLSILISIFSKKIITMLSIVGGVMILNIMSMLGVVIFETPAQKISNNSTSILSANIYNLNKRKNEIIDGMVLGQNTQNNSIKDVYENSLKNNIYYKLIYTDFSTQFSSLYTFCAPAKDKKLNIKAQFNMNTPYRLDFENYKIPTIDEIQTNQNNSSTSYICISMENINTLPKDVLFLFTTSNYTSINAKNAIDSNISQKHKYSLEEYLNASIIDENKYNLFLESIKNSTNNLITNLKPGSPLYPNIDPNLPNEQKIPLLIKYLGIWINNISSKTLQTFFSEKINKNESLVDSLIEFDKFIYSYSLNELNKRTIQISKNVNFKDLITKLTILRFLSLDIEKIGDLLINNNSSISSIINSDIEFNVNNISYFYRSGFKILPSSFYSTFNKTNIVPIFNVYALSFSWIIIGFFIMLITMNLYLRRDFK